MVSKVDFIDEGRNRSRVRRAEHDPEKWVPVFGKRSCSGKLRFPSQAGDDPPVGRAVGLSMTSKNGIMFQEEVRVG